MLNNNSLSLHRFSKAESIDFQDKQNNPGGKHRREAVPV